MVEEDETKLIDIEIDFYVQKVEMVLTAQKVFFLSWYFEGPLVAVWL